MRIIELIKSKDPRYAQIWYFLAAYFLVLFNYPLVRAAATTLFIEEFGAKSSPGAWLVTVGVLSITIFIFNHFQIRHSVQKVFFGVSLLSTLLFAISFLGVRLNFPYASYVSFIWKEICIVLQVHLLLGYSNNFFHRDDFKFVVGPVGAIGSIGGILGGLSTTYLSTHVGTEMVAWTSLIFVFLPAIFFLKTPAFQKSKNIQTDASPMSSLNSPELRKYVLLIGSIVVMSQFIINIADFKFNLAFEANIQLSDLRTAYLGNVYTWTNFISLVLQFAFLPLILPKITDRSLHLFLPLSYLFALMGLIILGDGIFLLVVSFYVFLKASDYSLLSAGKELLYQPLLPEQKYGAKYLTDMLVYRFSKALIAAVLIYLQSSLILKMMMMIFLIIWTVLIILLFRHQKRFFN
jgi:AAA family ATP:ADP antiporter